MAVNIKELDQKIHVEEAYDVKFRESQPLLMENFSAVIDAMVAMFKQNELDAVEHIAGVASRGYIFGAAIADRLGKNFVRIAKAKDKMVGSDIIFSDEYGTEYSQDRLKVMSGSGGMIIIDDLIATGGSLKAAADVATKAGFSVKGFGLLIDLTYVSQGFEWSGIKPRAVLKYDEAGLMPITDSTHSLNME